MVVGTANAMSRPRGEAGPAPQAAPQPMMAEPAPAAGITEDSMAKLKQLAELHQAGILTDAEFQDQKSRLLG